MTWLQHHIVSGNNNNKGFHFVVTQQLCLHFKNALGCSCVHCQTVKSNHTLVGTAHYTGNVRGDSYFFCSRRSLSLVNTSHVYKNTTNFRTEEKSGRELEWQKTHHTTTGHVNWISSITNIFFLLTIRKFWRSSVILMDCNSNPCPVGGRCVKSISYWHEIPVSSVAAERGFSFQSKMKTAMRSRLSAKKIQNLTTITSALTTLDAFDYAQGSAQFKSIQTRRKVGVQARPQQLSLL